MSAPSNSTDASEGNEGDTETPPASRPSGWSAWTTTLRDVSPYLDLGWRLMGAAAFPVVIGYGADAGLGTSPWGLLVGCGAGLASAAVQLKRLSDEFGR